MSYAVRADLDQIFGTNNVETWADLDNDESAVKIAARVTAAIVVADEYIDSFMRDGPYVIPLVDSADATPTLIRDASAKIAGVRLYEARGVEDATDGEHRLMHHKKEALIWLRQLHAGILRTSAISVENFSPTVVSEA